MKYHLKDIQIIYIYIYIETRILKSIPYKILKKILRPEYFNFEIYIHMIIKSYEYEISLKIYSDYIYTKTRMLKIVYHIKYINMLILKFAFVLTRE